MTDRRLPGRDDVVAMLATYRDRDPAEVGEQLDSLELTWLVAQIEQRYPVSLDLSDETFARMRTVSGAVEVLRDTLGGAGRPAPPAGDPAATTGDPPAAGDPVAAAGSTAGTTGGPAGTEGGHG